ncbi:hypothetical protein B0H11DRAFT_1921424 [Mycena galericulata]|nr:hypothetical protein B0H11DRAFT_1921424 [Mycena galericulata]
MPVSRSASAPPLTSSLGSPFRLASYHRRFEPYKHQYDARLRLDSDSSFSTNRSPLAELRKSTESLARMNSGNAQRMNAKRGEGRNGSDSITSIMEMTAALRGISFGSYSVVIRPNLQAVRAPLAPLTNLVKQALRSSHRAVGVLTALLGSSMQAFQVLPAHNSSNMLNRVKHPLPPILRTAAALMGSFGSIWLHNASEISVVHSEGEPLRYVREPPCIINDSSE